MIQENKANEVSDLLKEHYSFSPTLTRQVLGSEQFQNQIVDEKFCNEVIRYVYENKLVVVDNQKVALGKQKEDFYNTFGIFVYTKPTEKELVKLGFKVKNPKAKLSSEEYNQQMDGRIPMSIKFQDVAGEECVIEEGNSNDKTPMLWLGIKNVQPRIEIKGKGFVDYPLPEEVLVFGSMLLNQEQVKILLPYLQTFVEHGKIEKI